jgi:cytosine deaminase
VARALAAAGVAVTVLPATDLYLMGRQATHAKPRGVLDLTELRRAGVTCSLATNNVLNPFTPYGDGSLVRIANLYANVSHLGAAGALADCLSMVSDEAALLMGLEDYGIRPGNRADLVLLDAEDASRATAELAEARWGMRSGQMSFVRPPPELLPPAGTSAGET